MNLSALLHSDLVWLAPALAVAGVATGVLAGLFGVGGGAIIVPVLYQTLRFTGVPDEVAMPVSVGTSLAVIVPTSLASARVGRGLSTIELSICVAVMTGFPARLHSAMMRF